MRVNEGLRVCSLVTLGGSEDALDVIESYTDVDYDWVVYVTTSMYDPDWVGTARNRYVNSGLLEMLFNNCGYLWDLEGKGYFDNYFNLDRVFARCWPITSSCDSLLNRNAEDGYIELGRLGDNHEDDLAKILISPFMGKGTLIPEKVTASTLANAVMLCKNPANTYVTVSGELQAAQDTLGAGLEKIRAVYLSYLGIIPSDNSVPIDMPVPFVFTHYNKVPSMLQVAMSQQPGDNPLLTNQLRACMLMAGTMYSLLEIDHGYLGVEVLGGEALRGIGGKPREWCISTSTSTTWVPFRYPALVHLLVVAQKYKERLAIIPKDEPATGTISKPVILANAFTKMGSRDPFPIVSFYTHNRPEANYPLYQYLPVIARSFFISLYRQTCRGILCVPSKKDYPRRSEASREFIARFEAAKPNISLSGYLDLARYLVTSSVLSGNGDLHWLAAQLKVEPYDLLLAETELPALRVTGTLDSLKKEGVSRLFPYSGYQRRMKSWAGVKVINEWGLPVDLSDETSKLVQHNLTMLQEAMGGADKYDYVRMDHLVKMSAYHGFKVRDITPEAVSDKFLGKVVFEKGVINGITLKTLESYHKELKHPATGEVLRAVCGLLTAKVMDSYTGLDIYSDNIEKLTLYICIKDYLDAVLNSCRV